MMTLARSMALVVVAFSLFSRPDPDVALGNRLFEEGKYSEALEAYQRAKARSAAERRRLAFNRGTTLLKLGEHEQAINALREAQGDTDPILRSRAAYNEGNAAFAMKDLPGAVRAFRKSLVDDPAYEAARRNLELALLAMQRPDAGTPDASGSDSAGDGGPPDGGNGEGGDQSSDGGQQSGDGGGQQGDGGQGQDGGASQQPQQQPQPQQQEITEQDALRLLDSLRDEEQDRLLMRFLEQDSEKPKSEKTW